MKQVYHCLIALGGLLGIWVPVNAQSPQGIRGKIVDIETYEPIAGVNIWVPEVGGASTTNEKGEFSIALSEKGPYRVVSKYLGYLTDTTSVNFDNATWQDVHIVLVAEASNLEEVVVSRRRAQFTEMALLEERRNSNLILEKMGSEELSRKGVSDAKNALTKMSGVTHSQSDANVFVRGLGDRYNNTTLNGLALPSEDPLNKNISLDFFGTDIIQSIGVHKTYNPMIAADVAGANIDIVSKELTEDAFIEIGISSGMNTRAVSADEFKRVDGTNWLGSLSERKSPISNLESYSFGNNWNPKSMEAPINSSYSLRAGKRFRIGANNLNVFLAGNMNSDYKYFDGIIRQSNTEGTITLDQQSTRSQYHVSKTGMLNAKYSFGEHYVTYNALYIGDQHQEYERNFGFKMFDVADNGLFRRSYLTDNHLLVNQLLSKVKLAELWQLDLGLAYNFVKNNEPDRRTLELLEPNQAGVFRLYDTQNYNERYYADLTEKGWSAKAIITYKLKNELDLDRKIELGYNGNMINRDFNALTFGHRKLGGMVLTGVDIEDMDGIYGKQSFQNNGFVLETGRGTSFKPYWYEGEKRIHSAMVSATYQFTDRLTSVIGVRYDNVEQSIVYDTNMSNTTLEGPSEINKNYVLPSLNLKYALSEISNIRAAASMTYTLPQFVETAYFRNSFSTYSTIGNQNLVPVQNTNFDVKWEMFPSSGELFSVAAFYKMMKDPIARSETGNNVMTYYNVGSSATVAGAEVEIKKKILTTNTDLGENILSGGLNVSYLYTRQDLENPNAIFSKAGGTSALQGASPWLVNADLTYLLPRRNWTWTSTLLLNYFSDRIYAIGTQGFNDVVEKSVPTVDFISSATINKKWGLNVKARNILNPAIRLEREADQGDDIVLGSFRLGVDVSLGVSYRF